MNTKIVLAIKLCYLMNLCLADSFPEIKELHDGSNPNSTRINPGYSFTEQTDSRTFDDDDVSSNVANHNHVKLEYRVTKMDLDEGMSVDLNSSLAFPPNVSNEDFEDDQDISAESGNADDKTSDHKDTIAESVNTEDKISDDKEHFAESGTADDKIGDDKDKTVESGNADDKISDVGERNTFERVYNVTDWIPYTDKRLPGTIRPHLYEITLHPHIYGDDPLEFWVECVTRIHITVSEDTDMIYLHSLDHNVTSISLTNAVDADENCQDNMMFSLNHIFELLEIRPGCSLKAGSEYVLTIWSESSLSESLKGFYYSPYQEGTQTKYIFTTMMEPTDARRVFPCFDEPDFKALFTFKIIRQGHLISVTNLPIRTTKGPDSNGFYTDIFDDHRDVRMSTYLVAIAIGELDCLTSSINGTLFRTWGRPEAVNKTRYALEIGMAFMEFFEQYFQIPYALPKEDMIAVPTMSFSGMEHWGLITYRENALIYEEGVSSLYDMEWTSVLVAHEIAHQWFGNLVSPFWWDDLWLNEGFATYMMYLAVDRVMPSWKMMDKLVTDTRGVHMAMSADEAFTSHPVYVEVYDPEEILRIFDLISYAKGGAIIRMMQFFLGEETFRQRLTNYLKKFSFKTATHNDLWEALSGEAYRDDIAWYDVKSIMDTWVLEKNYPVVMVTRIDDVTIEISQSVFLRTEEERKNRSHVLWKIPFVYTTEVENNFDKDYTDVVWLNNCSLQITDESLRNASWIIGNIQQYGFYRVNYERENWEAILDQLQKDHSVIHPINRAQIINDAWNLASAGLLDFSVALATLDYLDFETDFVPWKAALRQLSFCRTALQMTPIYGLFELYMQKKLERAYLASVGAEEHYERLQFAQIAENACMYGLPACIADASEKFNAWTTDDNISVEPDLKEIVYCIGVRTNGYQAWKLVFKRFVDSQSTSEKRFLLRALTCLDQPWMVMLLFEKMFKTDAFSKNERVEILQYLTHWPVGRISIWFIIEEHWDLLIKEYEENGNLMLGIIEAISKSCNTEFELQRLQNLAQRDGVSSLLVKTAANETMTRIRWMDIYYDQVKSWLMQHS